MFLLYIELDDTSGGVYSRQVLVKWRYVHGIVVYDGEEICKRVFQHLSQYEIEVE
jgi:hypothetical protein